MTDQVPGPDLPPPVMPASPLPPPEPYAQQPYAQQHYTQQPYVQQPYGYQTLQRPPLSKLAKRGAFWAGAVGFNLLTLGFYLVVVPITAALFGAFFSFVMTQVTRSGSGSDAAADGIRQFFDSLDYGLLALLGGVVIVVGLAIMAAGLFSSVAILKSHETRRPWPVTWAGAGVAIVGFWFVGWIPSTIGQLAGLGVMATGVDTWVGFTTQIVLVVVGLLVGNAIIGWLSWWWMAHALRPRAGVVSTDTALTNTALRNTALRNTALINEVQE